MQTVLWGLILADTGSASEARGRGTVVLLHGLMNRPWMMKPFESALKRDGYRVVNWGYASRDKTIEGHALDLDGVLAGIPAGDTVNLVGFSMGGLIARYYLTHYPARRFGKLVMIGTPNHGSERVDRLYPYRWFRWVFGTKSTWQMRASNTEFFKSCGVPPCPFGIIAGGRGDTEGYRAVLPGDDDGAVTVESAKLPGAADFILLNHRHTLLLFSADTVDQVVSFLNRTRFIHAP